SDPSRTEERDRKMLRQRMQSGATEACRAIEENPLHARRNVAQALSGYFAGWVAGAGVSDESITFKRSQPRSFSDCSLSSICLALFKDLVISASCCWDCT